jgi:hypothetical protein
MFRDLPSEPVPPLHLDLEKKTLGSLEEGYIRQSSVETEEVGGIALVWERGMKVFFVVTLEVETETQSTIDFGHSFPVHLYVDNTSYKLLIGKSGVGLLVLET